MLFFHMLFGFSIADLKCREYIAQAEATNQTSPAEPLPLIISGDKSVDGEFPHMAHIGCRKNGSDEYNWACGGSLISKFFILTAAHCTDNPDIGVPALILLGSTSIHYQKNTQLRNVKKTIKYPTRKGYYNDIALIRMDRPVVFDSYVRPACLNTCEKCQFDKVVATGYGVEDYTSTNMSEHLLKTHLEIYPNENCSNIHGQTIKRILPQGVLKSQLCAGSTERNDTCHGDSGGPLQIQLNTEFYMYKIIGLTSFGLFCGQPSTPSFYTRISYYVRWIENIVW
ncbi:serine protease snake-like [Harmonia axyridis]|uniref:serine protease snake-like n=1 Tax=Harmonia axyridis TaxID=115357 RepID=UPI001E277395|nr:serine protease snake-like [Harmonia axyridis]